MNPKLNPKWRGLPALAAITIITVGGLFLSTGQALALGPQCTSPYVQVQDGAAAFFPDPTNQYSIEYVSVGEARDAIPVPAGGVGTNIPALSCTGKRLIFQMKVPTMDPAMNGTVRVPPESAWRVNFLVPASKMQPTSPTEAHQDMTVWVIFTSDPRFSTTGIFAYGYFNSGGNGATVSPQSVVTGNVGPDGTFTWAMNIGSTLSFPAAATGNGAWTIDPSVWGTFPLTQIQGETDVTVGIVLFTDALTVGDGVYTLNGNLSCSAPPVAALAAAPTSGNAPLLVNFDASASNIPVGGCGTIGSYNYTFGDGAQVTQSTPTVSNTYTTGGVTYQARVTVTSTVGLTSSNIAQQNITVNTAGPPVLTSIVSRMTHTGVGDFDIVLPQPPATRNVECRSGGASNNYKLVVTFLHNVTSVGGASVTGGAGSVPLGGLSLGPNSNQCTVNLTGVTNDQSTTVTLSNALDSSGALGPETAIIGVLIGDTTNNGSVNSSDISQTKAQSGTVTSASNFRTDVTVNGLINSSDISTVKSKSGTALP
jgi:hypothetical protein